MFLLHFERFENFVFSLRKIYSFGKFRFLSHASMEFKQFQTVNKQIDWKMNIFYFFSYFKERTLWRHSTQVKLYGCWMCRNTWNTDRNERKKNILNHFRWSRRQYIVGIPKYGQDNRQEKISSANVTKEYLKIHRTKLSPNAVIPKWNEVTFHSPKKT